MLFPRGQRTTAKRAPGIWSDNFLCFRRKCFHFFRTADACQLFFRLFYHVLRAISRSRVLGMRPFYILYPLFTFHARWWVLVLRQVAICKSNRISRGETALTNAAKYDPERENLSAWHSRASQEPRGNSRSNRHNFPNAIRSEFRLMTTRMSNNVSVFLAFGKI